MGQINIQHVLRVEVGDDEGNGTLLPSRAGSFVGLIIICPKINGSEKKKIKRNMESFKDCQKIYTGGRL